MPPTERTRDLYEELPGYPKPPLVPLPEFDNSRTFFGTDVREGWIPRAIARAVQRLTGFTRFQHTLPENLERLLRTTNVRGPILFAPPLSATLALADDPRIQDPVMRAATVIAAARTLHHDIMAGALPPDVQGGRTLEMGQYPNLFSTSTIVERRRPRIFKSAEASRVLVLCGRRAFLLDLGSNGHALTTGQVYDALLDIAAAARREPGGAEGSSLGLLTAASHSRQLLMFTRLRRSSAAVLEECRHTLFTLCLDLDAMPSSYAEAALLAHGTNQANRWFHASLQVVVFGNARACAICNFSAYLDGVTMARGGREIQQRAAAEPLVRQEESGTNPPVRELPWSAPAAMVRRALRDVQSILDNQQATFTLGDFGRQACAGCDISPVSLFTIALQLTALRFTGQLLRITQFINMSQYRCMGLGLPVVTTPEVERAVRYLESPTIVADQADQLLRSAVAAQKELLRKARHCLELDDIVSLFMLSRPPGRGQLAMFLGRCIEPLIRRRGATRLRQRHIVVSFPEALPEVPVIGRPGIRLPYTKYFGLHYQIFDDHTVVTMMPGLHWTVPNAEFIRVLDESLKRTLSCLNEAKAADRVEG